MITTQDIRQEGSRKAGEPRGAGLHGHQGQGPSGGLQGAAGCPRRLGHAGWELWGELGSQVPARLPPQLEVGRRV